MHAQLGLKEYTFRALLKPFISKFFSAYCFLCIDWRYFSQLSRQGRGVFLRQKLIDSLNRILSQVVCITLMFDYLVVFLNLHRLQICIANIIQRLMKKNASCRSIRTNITSPSNIIKTVLKKPQLDILSCKSQLAPKIEIPGSAKYPSQLGFRKKMYSNAKLVSQNNQNLSQVNLLPSSPTNGLTESTRAYDQLKNKISNLEGRLVEIKKNFELSFHKRADKSKNSKDIQPFRQKQKSKLVLNKQQEKVQKQRERQRTPKVQPVEGRGKDKENIVRKKTVQIKAQTGDSMLHEYVTTFNCQPPTNLTQCTSQANLFKIPKSKQNSKSNKYYISALIAAYSNPKPTSFDQLCRNHLVASLDILHYIKNTNKPLPPMPNPRKLPPTSKPTLVFDLDETLIHCNQHATMPCDVLLPIRFPNGAIVKAGINIRPWARQCLDELSKQFELIVFTASHQCYANVIIDYLDQKRLISHRYFRDSCWRSQQGFYVKDLRVLDRDLRNVLLIDNAAYSYCFQLDNGVPIVPFYDNKADLELKSLTQFFKNMGSSNNIRAKSASVLKLSSYGVSKDPRELISRLYESD